MTFGFLYTGNNFENLVGKLIFELQSSHFKIIISKKLKSIFYNF